MPLINTGTVEEFEPIPAGTYDFILTDAEYIEESASSGEPYIKFELTCDEGEFQNRKVFMNKSCQPKALWALKRDLLALGVSPEVLSGEWDSDDILPDIISNPCRAKISVREYEGREVNQVDRVFSTVAV